MKYARTMVIAIAMMGIAILVYAGSSQPADPELYVFEHVSDTFIGTNYGQVMVQVYQEKAMPMGLPEPNVPGYVVLSTTTTGQPGEVVATRILRQD